MTLSPAHVQILIAMHAGATLQVQRTLDGAKLYILRPPNGPDERTERATVEYLKRRGLIHSNMKFPSATYFLTSLGASVAEGHLMKG